MSARGNVIQNDITRGQVRAARSFIEWGRARLSEASGVPVRTIARLEDGDTQPRQKTLAAIRTALEAAGVEFIASNGGGPGVRLRLNPAQESP